MPDSKALPMQRQPEMAEVVLVMPTYNEKENIGPLLERIEAIRGRIGTTFGILFVDDSSPDGTGEEIARFQQEKSYVGLLIRPGKLGIGSAYAEGFKFARGSMGAEVVVEMDADLQHPPEKILELVEKVRSGADAALASRYIEGGGVVGWGRRRRLVSGGANWLARTVLGLAVRDCTSGFRAFGRAAVEDILSSKSPSKGFAFQVSVLYILKNKRREVVEVPYLFAERARGRSKLGLADQFGFFVTLLRLRFRGP
jgi:dolichol-phosphate mannosyltransferase